MTPSESAAWHAKMAQLEQSFAGEPDPTKMGTTGLIGWVCVSRGFRLYQKVRTAQKIIRSRGGCLVRFKSALLRHADEYRREQITRYYR